MILKRLLILHSLTIIHGQYEITPPELVSPDVYNGQIQGYNSAQPPCPNSCVVNSGFSIYQVMLPVWCFLPKTNFMVQETIYANSPRKPLINMIVYHATNGKLAMFLEDFRNITCVAGQYSRKVNVVNIPMIPITGCLSGKILGNMHDYFAHKEKILNALLNDDLKRTISIATSFLDINTMNTIQTFSCSYHTFSIKLRYPNLRPEILVIKRWTDKNQGGPFYKESYINRMASIDNENVVDNMLLKCKRSGASECIEDKIILCYREYWILNDTGKNFFQRSKLRKLDFDSILLNPGEIVIDDGVEFSVIEKISRDHKTYRPISTEKCLMINGPTSTVYLACEDSSYLEIFESNSFIRDSLGSVVGIGKWGTTIAFGDGPYGRGLLYSLNSKGLRWNLRGSTVTFSSDLYNSGSNLLRTETASIREVERVLKIISSNLNNLRVSLLLGEFNYEQSLRVSLSDGIEFLKDQGTTYLMSCPPEFINANEISYSSEKMSYVTRTGSCIDLNFKRNVRCFNSLLDSQPPTLSLSYHLLDNLCITQVGIRLCEEIVYNFEYLETRSSVIGMTLRSNLDSFNAKVNLMRNLELKFLNSESLLTFSKVLEMVEKTVDETSFGKELAALQDELRLSKESLREEMRKLMTQSDFFRELIYAEIKNKSSISDLIFTNITLTRLIFMQGKGMLDELSRLNDSVSQFNKGLSSMNEDVEGNIFAIIENLTYTKSIVSNLTSDMANMKLSDIYKIVSNSTKHWSDLLALNLNPNQKPSLDLVLLLVFTISLIVQMMTHLTNCFRKLNRSRNGYVKLTKNPIKNERPDNYNNSSKEKLVSPRIYRTTRRPPSTWYSDDHGIDLDMRQSFEIQ